MLTVRRPGIECPRRDSYSGRYTLQYLWSRGAGKGETEGRRERPVAVGVRLPRENGDWVIFFPITTKLPEKGSFAFEIPQIEKRRAGLDTDRQLWIIMEEFNSDVVGRSFYLESEPPIGRFSKALFLPILREFIARRSSMREVVRGR